MLERREETPHAAAQAPKIMTCVMVTVRMVTMAIIVTTRMSKKNDDNDDDNDGNNNSDDNKNDDEVTHQRGDAEN